MTTNKRPIFKVEDLKKMEGLESLSNEEAELAIRNLEEFSVLLFELFTNELEKKDRKIGKKNKNL